jgi:hypothetical protein
VQRYLQRLSFEIYDDDLKFLVTNRWIILDVDKDISIWTVDGEVKNEVMKLTNVNDNS